MTNQMERRIANYMFRKGTELTSGGSWAFGFEEIEEQFNVKITDDVAIEILGWLQKLYPEAIQDCFVETDFSNVTDDDLPPAFEIVFNDFYYDCDDPSVYDGNR